MKLRYSPTSPYVRKVMVTAIESALDGRMELIPTTPSDPASDLPADNPLGKVPALVTDGGERLYDSPVICEYLDGLHDGERLFPPSGAARWTALRLQALGDGILDAAVGRIMEARRPDEFRWQGFHEAQSLKTRRALDSLEQEAHLLEGPLTIGQVAVGCALGYLDFRFSEEDWRGSHPALAAWYGKFADRESMRRTAPEG